MKFWQDLEKITGIGLSEKMLIGRNNDGTTMYTDAQELYSLIAQTNFAEVKPELINSGFQLGTPNKLAVYYANRGVYYNGATQITIDADLAIFLWNKSTWTYFTLLDGYLRKNEFTDALQSEINRSPITTKEFGTKLNGGGSFDNIVFGQWRFNEIGVSDKTGTLKEVYVWVDSAGSIPLLLITSNGTTATFVRGLGNFTVTAGFNTITLNEAILAGQIVAVGNGTTSVKLGFKTSGLTGNRFVQWTGSALAYGSAGSYYCIGFLVESTNAKPLDPYATKQFVSDLYSTKDNVTASLITNNKLYEVRQQVTAILTGEALGGATVTDTSISVTSGSTGHNAYLLYSANTIKSNFNTYFNLQQIRFEYIIRIQGTLQGQLVTFSNGISTSSNFEQISGEYYRLYTDINVLIASPEIKPAIQLRNTTGAYNLPITITIISKSYRIISSSATYQTQTTFQDSLYEYFSTMLLPFLKTADLSGLVYLKADADARFVQPGLSFADALQSEINRTPVVQKNFGTKLNGGGSFDSITGQWKFNELGVSDKNGTLKEVYFWGDIAGTIPLLLITSNGTTATFVRGLGNFTVTAGFNTITLNEAILAGQIVAVGGSASSVKMAFKGTGLTGNRFAQANPAISYGGSSSYYALGFMVEYSGAKPLDIYSTLQYVDNRFTAITSQKIQKVVRRNGTPGTDCDFAGNRAIQDCIESITDASQYKQYEILVYEGIYEATQTTDYNSAGITTGMVSFLRGKSFVSVRGVSRDRVIIRGSLPSNLSSSVYQYYQTAYWHADFGNLEEVSIENTNGRYPLHIDGGQTGCAFFTSNIINVRLVHNGNTGNATAWSSWHPLGLGTSNGQIIVAKNAIFISKKWPQYVHNNSNFTKPSSVTYNSCRFETLDPAGDKIASKIQSLGSSKKDLVEFNNCRFEGCFIMSHDDIPFIPSVLADQYVNHADFRILGSGNSPLLYEPNFKGLALRITSKSTGTTSTVRFDTNSTAFTTVIKDNKYNGDWLNDFGVNNVSGYAYKDGYTGVSGYAIGRLDCGDDKVGIASDLYIKSLGKRLGDCSVTNKTLTVIIDGTSFNIVFNKNYVGSGTANTVPSDYSNQQVLDEINAVISSVATADMYGVANDYYPEFSDVLSRNRTSEVILKGMAVALDGGFVRKALSTDNKIFGVAIDDANVGSLVRVIVKGYLRTFEGNRFSTLQETYSTIVKGDQLGISATPGKISKTASIKHFTCFQDGIVSFNI